MANPDAGEKAVNSWLMIFILSFVQELVTVQILNVLLNLVIVTIHDPKRVKKSYPQKLLGMVVDEYILMIYSAKGQVLN